jgi:hypothetical protein
MGKKHTKHRRRSRIETELPVAVREEVHRLLLDGMTYDDVKLYLDGKGYEISRSSVGRYGKDFFEVYRDVIRYEEQAKLLVSEAGEGLMLEEAATKLLMQKVMAALVDGSADILEIPRLLSDVAKLQSSNLQREKWKEKFAEKVRKQALEEAADTVEETARQRGMSDADAQFWREKVLGIR